MDYKFKFKNLNRKVKLSKIFDNNCFYIFDEDINYFFNLNEGLVGENVYLVFGYSGNIFRRLFSLGFSVLNDFKVYSLISFDSDDEKFINGLFLSKNGEQPLSEIDGYDLVWQEVLLQDYDFESNDIKHNLRYNVDFLKNEIKVNYSIFNCGVFVVSDLDFIKGYEPLFSNDDYFTYVVSPYQIEKNKIKLTDIVVLSKFVWDERNSNFKEYTENDYLDLYKSFLKKLDGIIDELHLRNFYNR